jgi:hypothetical protein
MAANPDPSGSALGTSSGPESVVTRGAPPIPLAKATDTTTNNMSSNNVEATIPII